MGIFNLRTIVLIILVIVAFNYFNKDKFDENELMNLPPETKILAFGDSITQGYRLDSKDSYPSQLANLLHVNIINAGISGETSEQGLARLPQLLKEYQPKILLLCEGGNDILRKRDLIQAKENLSKMIALAKENNVYVILIGVPKLDIINLKTVQLYQELSQEYQIPLDTSLEDILNDSDLTIDAVHPNKKGYEILAKNLAMIISQNYLPTYSF